MSHSPLSWPIKRLQTPSICYQTAHDELHELPASASGLTMDTEKLKAGIACPAATKKLRVMGIMSVLLLEKADASEHVLFTKGYSWSAHIRVSARYKLEMALNDGVFVHLSCHLLHLAEALHCTEPILQQSQLSEDVTTFRPLTN
jgi:hypothetical protein